MIRLTPRGAGVAASLVVLTVLASILRDAYVAAAAVALALIVLLDYFEARRLEKAECTAKPSSVKKRLWVWERDSFEVELECQGLDGIEGAPAWLKASLKGCSKTCKVLFEASFKYSGSYTTSSIAASRRSRLGFFSVHSKVELAVEYKVLPEALYWVIAALGLLGFRGLGTGYYGLSMGALRSSAGEYYQTREYAPGDSLRRVDWKATARTGKLMVKEFREEAGGGLALFYDSSCTGRYTCDKVASAALSVVIAACRERLPVAVFEVQEQRGYSYASPEAALAHLVSRVLEAGVVSDADIYEFAQPLTKSEVERLLKNLALRRREVSRVRDVLVGASRVFYVSALAKNTGFLLDVVDEANRQKTGVSVVVPAKPWLDYEDLEQAYRAYLTHENVVSKLRALGAEVVEWAGLSPGTTSRNPSAY
ncbi:MAG: DUF58 domain-containing protein [Desulfurococcaceae archaeon]